MSNYAQVARMRRLRGQSYTLYFYARRRGLRRFAGLLLMLAVVLCALAVLA